MKIVVKIGGTLIETATGRERIVERVARQFRAGHQILLVHGGGKLLTKYLDQAGVHSEFKNGLRVTTAEAIDGVVKVFGGTVNHSLLAAFQKIGVPAAGISGIDGGCLLADKLVGANGEDWGFVGKVRRVNPHLWNTLLAGGILPVMACMAVGDDGQIYNVNADEAAVACAAGFRADCLVFLTDVDGVKDGSGATLSKIDESDIRKLIDSGAVTGGMLAKLNAIRGALAQGISQVHIGNGASEGTLETGIAICSEGAQAMERLAKGGAVAGSLGTAVFGAAIAKSTVQ